MNLGTIEATTGGVGSVTVTNTGELASGTISVVGGAGITASGCAGTTLAPGGSCSISIVVSPSAPGVFTGTVTISANPGASPTPLTVSVTATVVAKLLFDVVPSTIDLGNIPVGVAAPRQLITVTARVSLTDLMVSASGADVTIDQAATTCTQALAANSSCTIAVNFLATTKGQKKDSVLITAGGAAAVTVTVPITATAQTPPNLVIAPTAAQFAAARGEASSPVGFGVGNTGDVATGSLVVAISGANAASFSQTNNCLALASLGTCTISVVYRPPSTAPSSETATLTVTDSSGTATASATLNGTATDPSTLQITPATAGDLGTVLVGATGASTVFTVTNVGQAASGTITATVASPDFIITDNGCSGTSLAAGGACTLAIALKPASAGAKSATLTVVGTAVASPAVKTLTGIGLTRQTIIVDPSSLDFQTVRVNMMGTEQTVTVTNAGGTATDAIVINKAGDFDVFPITSNGCSAPLPPLVGTCTFTVNFAPKAAKAYSASFTVTDGTSSGTVTVSGAGLQQTGLTITPSPVGACAEPNIVPALDEAAAITTTQCFPATVVGGTGLPVTATVDGGTTLSYGSTISFVVTADSQLPAGVADTGALTVAINPATPADFVIVTNGCTTPLLAGASCQVVVAFTPTALGLRQASLSVTSANGGYDNATLQGIGLSLLEIRPLDTTDPVSGDPVTGLDFGQVTVLGDQTSVYRDFLLIVRGPNSATANTSSVLTTLTDPTQPADFMYPPGMYANNVNPCNSSSNQAVTLDFTDGTRTGNQGAWVWNSAYKVFVCAFTVRFYPQSTKGDKTATLAATGSGNASDSKTLTGTATGPLTFNPSPANFSRTFQVGESSNTQTSVTTVTLSGEDVTVTLKNHSTTTDYGPVSLTLGGANADQFMIVGDTCSTVTLVHLGDPCYVTLAFVPTSAGAKTALLTANAGDESAQVVINGGATDPFDITITPDQYVAASANVHDFGTVAQTANTAWAAFTITNPAGSPNSAQVTWGVNGASQDGSPNSAGFGLADGNNHAFGTCGNTATTTLEPGQSCTFWVRFMPSDLQAVSATTALTNWIYATDMAKSKTVYVKATGKVGSAITIAPATYTFPDTPGGQTSAATTLTVTNNGTTAFSLVIPPNDANLAPFNVDQVTGCAGLGTAGLAGGATCQLRVTFIGISGVTQSVISEKKLTILANGFLGAQATTTLTGTSVKPAYLMAVGYANRDDDEFSAWSETINLGGVRVGESSGPVSLLFKNVGSVPTSSLSFGWAGAATNTQDGEFIINTEDPTRCVGKTSLAAGETCTVTVRFVPSSAEPLGVRATKNFTLSAVTGGLVQVFKFTATSLDPANSGWIGVSGGEQAFHTFAAAAGTTAKPTTGFPVQVFQLTNATPAAQPAALTLTDSGTNFTLITSGSAAGSAPCGDLSGGQLSASNSCTFAVGFRPDVWEALDSYRHATVEAGDLPGSVLGLYGRVLSIAQLTISPSQSTSAVDPYDFGQVVVNTDHNKSFTVTNTGETASAAVTMTVTGDTSGGRFNIGGACTSALNPGASCVGNITYSAPTAYSASAVAMTLTAVAPAAQSSEQQVVKAHPLNDTTLTVSPATLTFPTTSVGTTSTTQTVTLTNEDNSMTSGLLTIAIGDATNFSISVGPSCPVYTDPDATVGLVMDEDCFVGVAFTPKTLGTGTFETDLTMRSTPGSLKSIHITGVAQSSLHVSGPAAITTSNGVGNPASILVYLDVGAPMTSYIQTSLTGSDFRIVEDQCIATKLSGGEACYIKVAALFSANTPNKTATLTVNGGSAGNTGTYTLNSSP